MATNVYFYNPVTNTNLGFIQASASVNYTGIYHDGCSWYFLQKNSIDVANLYNETFYFYDTFSITGIPDYAGTLTGGIVGDGTSLFIQYESSIGAPGPVTLVSDIGEINKTTGDWINRTNRSGSIGTAKRDITLNGSMLKTVYQAVASGTNKFAKEEIQIRTGRLIRSLAYASDHRGIVFDGSGIFTVTARGSVDYVTTEMVSIGPQSSAIGVGFRAMCSILSTPLGDRMEMSNIGNKKAGSMLALLRVP